MRLLMVTGGRNSGKTALLAKLAAGTEACGGVYSPAACVRGSKSRYYVCSLRSGRRVRLLDIAPSGPRVNKAGFEFAERVIARNKSRRYLFVDEFGLLEAQGLGFYPALAKACRTGKGTLLLAVRKGLARIAAKSLGFDNYKLVDLDSVNPDKAVKWFWKYAG